MVVAAAPAFWVGSPTSTRVAPRVRAYSIKAVAAVVPSSVTVPARLTDCSRRSRRWRTARTAVPRGDRLHGLLGTGHDDRPAGVGGGFTDGGARFAAFLLDLLLSIAITSSVLILLLDLLLAKLLLVP